ncbi:MULTISPECIES: hypothetical protein [Viridibacillus]|nr:MULTISPECIES: hypothetical protein [Viridibacillus]
MKIRKVIVSLLLTFGLIVNFSSNFNIHNPSSTNTNIIKSDDLPIDGKH